MEVDHGPTTLFLLPDTDHALAVVNELVQAGVDPEQIHALADSGTYLGELPGASDRQIHDTSRRIEAVLWDGNLVVFGLALGVLVTLLVVGRLDAWLLLPLGVMLASFMAGQRFTRLPNTHIDELRDALAHGEILLMIDVPETRVEDIGNRVTITTRRQPPGVSAGEPGPSDSEGRACGRTTCTPARGAGVQVSGD